MLSSPVQASAGTWTAGLGPRNTPLSKRSVSSLSKPSFWGVTKLVSSEEEEEQQPQEEEELDDQEVTSAFYQPCSLEDVARMRSAETAFLRKTTPSGQQQHLPESELEYLEEYVGLKHLK
jgi:hypothetical protein